MSEVLDNADVSDTGREWPLTAGSHLVEVTEVAVLQTLTQRLQGRIVSLDQDLD